MANFFEKLQKGMGSKESTEIKKEKLVKEEKTSPAKTAEKPEKKSSDYPKLEIKQIEEKPSQPQKWSFREEEEGQLAIDIYQTEKDLIICSAIAGVNPEDLDIKIEKDVLTIKGKRNKPVQETGDYFLQECFWGAFSKEIILPAEVDSGRVSAEMKNGVLTVRMPKILRENKKKIEIKK